MSRLGIIAGAFALLRRRTAEVGQPALGVYADAGAAAATHLADEVCAAAHQNECAEISLSAQLAEIVADGKVDTNELKRLRRMPRTLSACAERSHNITEQVALPTRRAMP